jgi:predicted amidophosphoribosyltransferase
MVLKVLLRKYGKVSHMSSPRLITCWGCRKKFVFLRGSLEECPNCKTEYKSHRDVDYEQNEEKEEITRI